MSDQQERADYKAFYESFVASTGYPPTEFETWCAARAAQAATPAPAPLTLGRELFKFDTFSGWVNHAQRAWKAAGVRSEVTICIDAKGRPCRIGRDFAKARDESAFPVRVFLMRDEDDPEADQGKEASNG